MDGHNHDGRRMLVEECDDRINLPISSALKRQAGAVASQQSISLAAWIRLQMVYGLDRDRAVPERLAAG
jgi:hypothetical protein